jgi:hypothetical protein
VTPLARLGYEVMKDSIARGAGPERAWEAVAKAMTAEVRKRDRIEFDRHVRTKLGGSVER